MQGEADPAPVFEHAFRASVFSRERRYRLTVDALEWDDGEKRGSVPLRDVTQVRIFHQPGGGFTRTMRRTIVSTRSAGTIMLSSNHYVRLAKIEDRPESYLPFVEALVARVAAANPQARFVAGHGWGLWLLWLAVLIGSILVLALTVLVFLGGGAPWQAAIYVAILIGYLPIGWQVVRGSRPRIVDPRALPAGTFD